MATAEENVKLATETAEALLTAIKAAAPDANGSGNDALKHLAEAYSLVREGMPRPSSRGAFV